MFDANYIEKKTKQKMKIDMPQEDHGLEALVALLHRVIRKHLPEVTFHQNYESEGKSYVNIWKGVFQKEKTTVQSSLRWLST